MSSKETMLNTLARFSINNIPMLILSGLENEVGTIWKIAGRTRSIIVLGGKVEVTNLLVLSQDRNYDSILVREIEKLELIKQENLARCFTKITSEQKGKFIFTSDKFESLNKEFSSHLCKITYLPKSVSDFSNFKNLGWVYG